MICVFVWLFVNIRIALQKLVLVQSMAAKDMKGCACVREGMRVFLWLVKMRVALQKLVLIKSMAAENIGRRA